MSSHCRDLPSNLDPALGPCIDAAPFDRDNSVGGQLIYRRTLGALGTNNFLHWLAMQ